MADNGIRYVGVLKTIHDAYERLIGKKRPNDQQKGGQEAQRAESGEKPRHESTMNQIHGTIKALTRDRDQWDKKEQGWALRLSADNPNPDWPSKQWFLIADPKEKGRCSVSLHVDFGKEEMSGYTTSSYLLFDVTADEFVAKINEPGFAEIFYDTLADLEKSVRGHEWP